MTAALAALALGGCSGTAGNGAAANNTAADTQAAADAIRAEEAQWNRDYASRNVDAIMTHYAADGALSGPGDNPQTGTDAIRATVARMVGDPAFRLDFGNDRVEVASSGDLGFSRGHFTLTVSGPGGRPGTMRGTYLTVWRKQADGRWQSTEDMITPGPAAAAVQPAG